MNTLVYLFLWIFDIYSTIYFSMCYLWNNKLRITSSKVCTTSSTYTKYGLLVICLFPCTTRFFFQIILLTFKLVWWAQMELNHRPHAYQACALTIWAMSPYFRVRCFYLSYELHSIFNVPNHFSINLLLNIDVTTNIKVWSKYIEK